MTITTELRSTRQGGSSGSPQKVRYTVYPVRLKRSRGKPILVAESRRYLASRRRAELVAKFLGLGITDRTGGTTMVREAGTLDLSLVERLRDSGTRIDLPSIPSDCKVEQEVRGDATALVIPAAGFGLMEYLLLGSGAIMFLVGAGLAISVIAGQESTDPFQYALPAVLLIPGLVFVLKAVKEATTSQRITISPRGFTVKRRGPLSFSTKTIPVNELEDLAPGRVGGKMFGGSVLLARSDRAALAFGKGLSEAEQEWLLVVIQKALLAAERPY